MSRPPPPTEGFPPLSCPIDQTPLTGRNGALVCRQEHEFEMRRGIPRVVSSSARYADAFGEQWTRYRVTQLDSFTKTSISKDRLRRCLGERLWERLSRDQGIHVLETGCGAGRFTEVLLQLPAAYVTSVDLSVAVEANQANCPQTDRHRVIQCDINRLPFKPQSFDIVLCLGVIQHTPHPERTMAALYAQVKPGGWLVMDHYKPSVSHYTKITALLLRPVLKRLPPSKGAAATEWISRAFFPLHRAVKQHRLLQMVLSRFSPLLTYYHVYPQLDDRLQFGWATLDTHDSLTDYYKHFRTVGQIERALGRLGAQEVWVAAGGNGVEARCRRPPGPVGESSAGAIR